MIVVSDTSPILNLHAVDKLHLLRDLYGEIVIPPAVDRELIRNGVQLEPSWTRVFAADNQNQVAALREQLDQAKPKPLSSPVSCMPICCWWMRSAAAASQ